MSRVKELAKLKQRWVFIMDKDAIKTESLRAMGKQHFVVIKEEVTAIQAYNMMLKKFGHVRWTEMLDYASFMGGYATFEIADQRLIRVYSEL